MGTFQPLDELNDARDISEIIAQITRDIKTLLIVFGSSLILSIVSLFLVLTVSLENVRAVVFLGMLICVSIKQ